MKRRRLIRNLALGLPATTFLPSLLGSCEFDDGPEGVRYEGKVLIIGAGAAGLSAAYELHNQNIDVEIFEADEVWGGRIRSLAGWTDFAVELGADEIYGDNNTWHTIIADSGVPFAGQAPVDRVVLSGEPFTFEELADNPNIANIQSFVNSLANYSGNDISVKSAADFNNIPDELFYVLDGMIGSRYGANISSLSMKGVADGLIGSTAGEGVFSIGGQSLSNILNSKFNEITGFIKTSTQIKSIDFSGDIIVLTDAAGNTYEGTKLVLAVPITILREGDISFSPALPPEKTSSIQNIGMAKGMKVVLRFYTNFWGKDAGSLFVDGHCARYNSTGLGQSDDNRVLVAELYGEKAAAFEGMEDEAIISTLLQEIDGLYNGLAVPLFAEGLVYDWSAQPFIRGAFSYPTIGSSGSRTAFAKSVDDKIYFAGEAASINDFGTVHGAIDTGTIVATEIVESISEA